MSETFNKGEVVRALVDGRGDKVRGYGTVLFNEGDDLEITSINAYGLNVRKNSYEGVFRVKHAEVTKKFRPIGHTPEGGIDPNDPGLEWLWDDAGRLAERLGLCRDYDRLCDSLGVPGRIRQFSIKVQITPELEITAKVQARSKRLAEEQIVKQFMAAKEMPLIKAIGAGV